MRRRKVTILAAFLAIVLAILVLPPLLLRDAGAPVSLRPFIDGARARLTSDSESWWPLHLRFVEARCSSQNTQVALIFEAWRPLYLGTYAVAMRGSMPTSPDDAWMGAFGIGSVYEDDEFVYQMGTNTISCE